MILDKYGLPLILLGLCIYGGVAMYKALRASETARIQDAKDSLELYREDSAKAEMSREGIKTGLNDMKSSNQEMANEIRNLVREIRK